MGIDAVELVMEIEEEFSISIPDEDYQYIRTVGDMHQWIVRQIEVRRQLHVAHPTCPSIPAFLATRNAIVTLCAVGRNAVRPETKLADIIPRTARRKVWNQLQELTHIRLPPLSISPQIRPYMGILFIGLLASLLLTLVAFFVNRGVFIASSIFVCLLIALCAADRRLGIEFPYRITTVADIVRASRTPPYPPQVPSAKFEDADAVWEKLVAIIVDELGVSAEDVIPTATFVEDLKMY